jgi:hypothetical protein
LKREGKDEKLSTGKTKFPCRSFRGPTRSVEAQKCSYYQQAAILVNQGGLAITQQGKIRLAAIQKRVGGMYKCFTNQQVMKQSFQESGG